MFTPVNDIIGEEIVAQIIESTTWVHKADVFKTGTISEADYIVFKLQQLQMVREALRSKVFNFVFHP